MVATFKHYIEMLGWENSYLLSCIFFFNVYVRVCARVHTQGAKGGHGRSALSRFVSSNAHYHAFTPSLYC